MVKKIGGKWVQPHIYCPKSPLHAHPACTPSWQGGMCSEFKSAPSLKFLPIYKHRESVCREIRAGTDAGSWAEIRTAISKALQSMELFQLHEAASRARQPWTAAEIGEGHTLPALGAWTNSAPLGFGPKPWMLQLGSFAPLPFASPGFQSRL